MKLKRKKVKKIDYNIVTCSPANVYSAAWLKKEVCPPLFADAENLSRPPDFGFLSEWAGSTNKTPRVTVPVVNGLFYFTPLPPHQAAHRPCAPPCFMGCCQRTGAKKKKKTKKTTATGCVCARVCACSLPTMISRTPTKGRSGMLSVQQSATQEMMKAMMRMRRPMIIRAATAWAQARVRHKHTQIHCNP